MGFLTGLFQQTTPELRVDVEPISDDANVEPGYLYRVAGGDNPILIGLRPHSHADIAGKRFGVKVYSYTPPTRAGAAGGPLTVVVPAGQLVENDAGVLASSALVTQTVGMYREWLADSTGAWLLVSRIDPL